MKTYTIETISSPLTRVVLMKLFSNNSQKKILHTRPSHIFQSMFFGKMIFSNTHLVK